MGVDTMILCKVVILIILSLDLPSSIKSKTYLAETVDGEELPTESKYEGEDAANLMESAISPESSRSGRSALNRMCIEVKWGPLKWMGNGWIREQTCKCRNGGLGLKNQTVDIGANLLHETV